MLAKCSGTLVKSARFEACGVCAIIPLTRQFTVEYSALFDCVLPALQRLRLPMPLGGTSNHFPRAVLAELHGWDPYNVTEDADLGIRIARLGYRVAVLSSTTWEEAPADVYALAAPTDALAEGLDADVSSAHPAAIWFVARPRFFPHAGVPPLSRRPHCFGAGASAILWRSARRLYPRRPAGRVW